MASTEPNRADPIREILIHPPSGYLALAVLAALTVADVFLFISGGAPVAMLFGVLLAVCWAGFFRQPH